jgi:diketogulonate reductase-like aldo/keto reductase
MDYVDMYLIHWPLNGVADFKIPMHKLWAIMESFVDRGLVKSIGVSNFNIQLMADMLTYCKIKPACNQVQLYPECVSEDLVQWMDANEITPVAYSPVGRYNSHFRNTVESVESPIVQEIAKKHGRTACQILLAWGLQRGYVVIPKANQEQHQKENLEAFEIKLSEEEMKQIASMDRNRQIFYDFDEFKVNNIFA